MKRSSLKKNTYFVAIGQLSQKVLAFALIPFAARYLGDDGFGKFSLASTIMFFVFLFNDLGINTYITREIAKNRDIAQRYFFNSLVVKIALITLNFVLLALFLYFANYATDTNYAIIIFAGYGITTSVMQLSIGIFEAFERMQFEAIVLTLEKIFITGIGIYVLLKGYGLIIFCGAFLAGGIFSSAVSFFILKRHFNFSKSEFQPEVKNIKTLVSSSLPFGISVFISTVYSNIGVIILSLIKTEQAVGWFSASYKFIAITAIIPMITVAATYPAFSRQMHESRERVAELFTKCMKYLSYAAFPLVAGTIILADKIIMLIYGKDFVNATYSLKVLVWAAALMFFNIFFTGILKAANLQKLMIKIQVIGLGINIILNLIFIHYYSYIGAAITIVCTEVFIFVTFYFVAYQKIAKLGEVGFLLKNIVATAIMALFTLHFKTYNLFAVVFASSVIFAVSLFLMKGFTFDEILPVSGKLLKRGNDG
ncbi:flippase [candidate division KSB1 bacterium]|nr:flippase [candidate division KSB1 bacterium]